MQAAEDPKLAQALAEVGRAASAFWHAAPDYVARETLNQKALSVPKRRLRVGASALQSPNAEFRHREIVSFYAFSSFRSSPEALREFREVISLDGQTAAGASSPERLRNVVAGYDDRAKRDLAHEFEKDSLSVTATDFGQLVLLFTKPSQAKYEFQWRASAMVGADRAMIVDFTQRAGGEALRVAEPGRDVREPLRGQIWIRESDFLPLRITLATSHQEKSQTLRDDARVDYEPKANGLVLPVSVVYRRFVNGEVAAEDVYRYAEWERWNRK